MSRKTTAALIAALGINFALAGGALMLANLNKPAEYDGSLELADYGDTDTVAGIKADGQAGDLIVPLKAAQRGGNTRVTFSCGKTIPSGREVHEGTWDQVGGAVLYRPDAQALLALEAVFDTRSLRTDAQGLTNTVTTKEKWFDIDNHPTATFTCDSIKPADAATPSHTHDLVGSFTLNGITKPITIPAKLEFAGQSLTIDAAFTLLRSDFDVNKRESSIAGSVGNIVSRVEDEVQMSVRVTASPDLSSSLAELATLVEDQQEQLRIADIEIDRLKDVSRRVELLEEQTSRLAAAPPANTPGVDIEALPKTFTDHAEGDNGPEAFDLVLVPGDDAEGVAPFYMATQEVRWGMIKRWMYANDLLQRNVSANEISKLIKQGLRPTPLYEDPAQMLDVPDDGRPALAMSLLTAKAYCKWLSEKTGRQYRLPTMKEWMHAAKLGGGLPNDLDKAAWHGGNHPMDEFGKQQSGFVATKAPNSLGIYDMFGNACEWVTGTGKDRVVVGGHFLLPPDKFALDWKAVEDLDIWCADSTQLPPGRFWFNAFYYTGIRLVCEPASVAANPPHVDPQ